MQRNISHQKPLRLLAYLVFFIIYSSLATIYPYLPPLFGVLYLFFARAFDREDALYIILISLYLVIFEANNGYILFSSIIYFYIVYKFIMPRISQNFSCPSCVKISFLLLTYIGYFLFLMLISNVFLLPLPHINYYIVYYIVIEFLLVSIL